MEEKSTTNNTSEKIFPKNNQDSNFREIKNSSDEEITQLKSEVELLERKLFLAKNDLVKQEKFSAIGELSSRISHDIRNPLAVIQSTVVLWKQIHKEDLDKGDLKRLEMIERSVSKIKHLTENLLDFVRTPEPHYREVSLLGIIDDTINSIHGSENITFSLPKNDLNIKCDPYQLEAVIKNLVANSIQAIDNNPGSITINFQKEKKSTLISVQDSGPGISKEIASKIFDPLFTTKKYGTGLGLVSCKSIIEAHSGTLTFSNNPTTFLITLPNSP